MTKKFHRKYLLEKENFECNFFFLMLNAYIAKNEGDSVLSTIPTVNLEFVFITIYVQMESTTLI